MLDSADRISLIVGLGNPGTQYCKSRHNTGFWFLSQLQQSYGFMCTHEKRYQAETGTFQFDEKKIHVIAPQTFMNLSGYSVAPFVAFYRIPSKNILIVHDELDLSPGTVRLKCGGGHGGHNGLRDITTRLGNNQYYRLRIGIGHPGVGENVSSYVLQHTPPDDKILIKSALSSAMDALPYILRADMPAAMKHLAPTHTSSIN